MKKNVLKKFILFLGKVLLVIGIVISFYKIPGIIANKISYWKQKKKNFTKDSDREDKLNG